MHAKFLSIGLKGMEGYRVQVEVHVVPDKPSMVIVGLPDASVKESKEHVLAALHFLKCQLSDKKIVVNLSPPEQKKNGPMFDLAMAIGILKASNHFPQAIPPDTAFLGALSLDGSLQIIDGLLPAVLAAKAQGVKRIFLPFDSLLPIHQIQDIECIPVSTLHDVIQVLKGEKQIALDFLSNSHRSMLLPKQLTHPNDFQNIYGQEICNGYVPYEQLLESHPLTSGQRKILQQVSSKQHWSNRVQTKIVRLARTISDLQGEDVISDKSIWEAMSLRRTNTVEKRKGKAKWQNG